MVETKFFQIRDDEPPNLTRQQQDDFWNRVEKSTPSDCWEWRGCRNSEGYGKVVYNGRRYSCHALAFFLNLGVWSNETVIRHSCDNPPCCNPLHLLDGTHAENTQDKVNRGRVYVGDRRGEKNSMASLTNEEVKRIKQLGMIIRATTIAELPEFKGRITRRGISRIINNERWEHLT